MVWRGSTSTSDRIFSALPYLIPAAEGLGLAGGFIARQPFLKLLLSPLVYLLSFLSPVFQIPSILVFFILLFAVIRNPRVPRFIRYNTALAIIADVALFLASLTLSLILRLFGSIDSINFVVREALSPLVGLSALAFCAYALVYVVQGKNAEIAAFSPTAYSLTQDG